ncbi:hypothetical protein D3C71_1409790 [compost metagenome]
MRAPTISPSSTVMATGLNTNVALEIAAVAVVHLICSRSSTFSGLGKKPLQLLTSGASENSATWLRFIRLRSIGEKSENMSKISGPTAMPRK